uniref:Uncharacterized protein n=1 Tax=Cryptomonas curvata TaxID=233186 RepID=A0A7S0MJE6_9CRYP|eukprot:CAMPEP_0172169598 /NCGR_PEP_ID=MMETSP1050-20130122/10794_1 /TAXON_ID=233186 /ORGANISM="Cryptomonas curvata, Strain CCAP979/52" /LENGTH=912 /DNA_ID=CAMNT_0012840673 /DNA_START=1932 /DNA_END=4670 /DNA_ORIENTATION=-
MAESHICNSEHDHACEGILWVEDTDNNEKIRLSVDPNQLAAVTTVEGLCQLIHDLSLDYAQCDTFTQRSLRILGLVNQEGGCCQSPFMIMDSSCSKSMQGGEEWIYKENSVTSPVKIKVRPSIFQRFSERCLTIFNDPLYHDIERNKEGTMYENLNLPAPTLNKRHQSMIQGFQEGYDKSRECRSIAEHRSSCSSEPAGAVQATGGDECKWTSQEFPKSILLSHLNMSTRDDDQIEGHSTLAFEKLKMFAQERENKKCVLTFRQEHKGKALLRNGEPCYKQIHIRCNARDSNGNPCSHFVRYKYTSLDPENGVRPSEHAIFTACNSGENYIGHSCNEKVTSASYGKPLQGRPAIPSDQLKRAIWCVKCAIPLRHIVASFGNDPLNYQDFELTMRQFRDAIRYRMRSEREDDMQVLLRYLNDRLEKGHTAFACVEGVSGSADQLRIFLQSAEQIMYLKEQRATVISLDFVYKLIPNVGLAFGHFTTKGPSGRLISLATFLIESEEGGDAIDWVFKKFEESLQKFGIECQSPVIFHDNASGHIRVLRKPGITEPTLVSKRIKLDLDQSICEFDFWRHPKYFESLCMAPTHLPKSWKRQIAKLNLSPENQKILLGRVWLFALRMELCDYAALDMEWESITRFALALAQVEPERDLVLLPAHLRLAHQALFSGISASAPPIDSQDQQTQFKLYTNVTECLDYIAERVGKEKSASRIDLQNVQSLQREILHVASKICSAGVQDENLEYMMAIHRELQKRTRGRGQQKGSKNANTERSSSSGSAVTSEIVVSAMQNIYSLARCWCQRVTCQGFTMQRKSSTWSEVSNNSIKTYISPSKRMNGEYTLSSFIMDVDQWIHRQFELSYQANKITYKFETDVLSDQHVTLLQQALCNGATSDVLKVLRSTMKKEYTVHDSEE